MQYKRISMSNVSLKGGTMSYMGGAGSKIVAHGEAYRVGPLYRQSKRQIPLPELHEYGGTITFNRPINRKVHERNGLIIMRKSSTKLTYPARPYMKVGAEKGLKQANKKFSRTKQFWKPKKMKLAS